MEGAFRRAGLSRGGSGPSRGAADVAERVRPEPNGVADRQGGQKARIAGIDTVTTMISRGSPGRQ